MSTPELIASIQAALREALQSQQIEVFDEDHLHHGHGESGAHIAIKAASRAFAGMPALQRHRALMAPLAPWLQDGSLHAIRIVSAQEIQ